MAESESFEEKSQFTWDHEGQQYDLLKTLVAFANCNGGLVQIKKISSSEKMLDSARLDDFVNKYVTPRLGGISSEKNHDGSWTISVMKSAFAPHVISQEASYQKGKKTKSAFYPGQVYVRHSSKSEPASGEDLQRLIREGVSSWLSNLGEAVAGLNVGGHGGDTAMPVRIVEGGPSLAISLGESHPYITSQLGKAFGKNGSWIGKLINRLKLRGDPRYATVVAGYKQPIYKYSELAKEAVHQALSANPACNPYSCDGKTCKCAKVALAAKDAKE